MKITKKQKILLDFIESFADNQGFSPSYREIAEARLVDRKSVV